MAVTVGSSAQTQPRAVCKCARLLSRVLGLRDCQISSTGALTDGFSHSNSKRTYTPMKARVFEGHKCTTGFHNALLDVVMPELKANTWKLLCVLIRQTAGWERDEQAASYKTLMEGTGISSKATIAASLKELLEYRYELVTIIPGTQHDESLYSINRDVEIDWTPRNFDQSSSSKNEPLNQSSGSKIKPLRGSINEPLKQSSGSKNELSYRKESIHDLKQGEEEAFALPFPELEKAICKVLGVSGMPEGNLGSRVNSLAEEFRLVGIQAGDVAEFEKDWYRRKMARGKSHYTLTLPILREDLPGWFRARQIQSTNQQKSQEQDGAVPAWKAKFYQV